MTLNHARATLSRLRAVQYRRVGDPCIFRFTRTAIPHQLAKPSGESSVGFGEDSLSIAKAEEDNV